MQIELVGLGRPIARNDVQPGQLLSAAIDKETTILALAVTPDGGHEGNLQAVVLEQWGGTETDRPRVLTLSSLGHNLVLLEPSRVTLQPPSDAAHFMVPRRAIAIQHGDLVVMEDGTPCIATGSTHNPDFFALTTGRWTARSDRIAVYQEWRMVLHAGDLASWTIHFPDNDLED